MKSLLIPIAIITSCVLMCVSLAWQRIPLPHAPAQPDTRSSQPLQSAIAIPQSTIHNPQSTVVNLQSTNAPAAVSEAQIKEWKEMRVNEAGRVPILEYHEIGANPPGAGFATRQMHRSIDEFQSDLQRLYDEGYRPVNLSEYLDNKMDLPAGTSPVILTFDDARSTQFRYLKDGSVDPNCAVGILQEFSRAHPDFPLKAMFYVLPEGAFGSERYAAKKLTALLKMGCELGNHTLSHHYFNRMSDAAIAKEIALGKKVTEKMVPGARLDTLALPGGCKPRSKNYGVLTSGEVNGVRYTNRAVIDAWGGPAPSPISIKYDPLRIPRVLGVNGSDGVAYYLDALKARGDRYVSDGDPNTVTIPKRLLKFIKQPALHGLPLRTYDDGRKTTPDEKPAATVHKRRRHRQKRQKRHQASGIRH